VEERPPAVERGLLFMGRNLRIVGTFAIWVTAAVLLAFVDLRLGIVVGPVACFTTVLLWRWGRDRNVSGEKSESQKLSA
jgi:hypothetical protein